MKKKKCEICDKNKARRLCKLHNQEMICSLCCAQIRNQDCGDCLYFEKAKQYNLSKENKTGIKPSVAEINEEVINAVDEALAFVNKGDLEQGQTMLIALKKDNPRNYYVHFGLGVIHAFKEQYDQAIKSFDDAIDIFPYFVEAHFNKALAYQKKFDIANVVKTYRQVISYGNPNDKPVIQAKTFIRELENLTVKKDGIDLNTYLEAQEVFDRAFCSMQNQEWEKAMEGFKQCLTKNERHSQTHGNMGLCYAQLGRKSQALKAFDRALEIDPNYEPAIINRMAVESLTEGEKLSSFKMHTLDYYKNGFLRK